MFMEELVIDFLDYQKIKFLKILIKGENHESS